VINDRSSLIDVAFAVCTQLAKRGLDAVLVGGSAATFYAPEAYQSFDADFVAQFAPNPENTATLVKVMAELGYELDGNMFVHRHGNVFTVEFPKGPLQVGGDLVKNYKTVKRDDQTLHVVSATDCVRDRLCAFYFWNDRSSLDTAINVAHAAPDQVDLELIEKWSAREGEPGKFAEFSRLLGSKRQRPT
jgi:hypothetical protein